MIEIEIGKLQVVEFDLTPEDINRDGSAPISNPRVSIGQPVVIALTRKLMQNDPEAIQSMNQFPDHVFHVLRLACTFHPSETGRIKNAALQVQCEPTGTAIAWSMLPIRDEDIEESSQKVTIGSKLGLKGLGVSGSQTTEDKRKQIQPFVTALNLQQSDPYWQFTPTPGRKVAGSFPLALVIRSLKGVPANGKISVRCTEEQKKYGLFTFVSPVDGLPTLNFAIHA